jgi:hypothetical protein
VVDLVERHAMRDQAVEVELALHVPIHCLRHLGAPARPAEGRALPDAVVTSWEGRVLISWPAPAIPTMTPLPWVARTAVQRLLRCDRQVSHCRHSGV